MFRGDSSITPYPHRSNIAINEAFVVRHHRDPNSFSRMNKQVPRTRLLSTADIDGDVLAVASAVSLGYT